MSTLRTWRSRHNVTQVQLAAQLGITQGAVSAIEAGVMPEPETVLRIVEITKGEVTAMDFVRQAVERRKESAA